VSMAGSTVVLCVFPRFLPAARAARVESGRSEGDPARRGPTNEELINREGVLIFAAGQAIWVIAALGAVSSVGMLVTIVLSAFGHRVLSQQLQELRAGNGSGPAAVTGDFMATPEKRTDKTRVLLLANCPDHGVKTMVLWAAPQGAFPPLSGDAGQTDEIYKRIGKAPGLLPVAFPSADCLSRWSAQAPLCIQGGSCLRRAGAFPSSTKTTAAVKRITIQARMARK